MCDIHNISLMSPNETFSTVHFLPLAQCTNHQLIPASLLPSNPHAPHHTLTHTLTSCTSRLSRHPFHQSCIQSTLRNGLKKRKKAFCWPPLPAAQLNWPEKVAWTRGFFACQKNSQVSLVRGNTKHCNAKQQLKARSVPFTGDSAMSF